MNDSLRRAAELEAANQPFVLATVVRVDRPVSARAGDRAVIMSDGTLSGWVGGSCSEPIVVREAIAALSGGSARLVRIRPPGAPREPPGRGVVVEVTACESEGGLDVFVEPHPARPHLVVVGSSPVARTLAELARDIGYRVSAAFDAPSERVAAADETIALDALSVLSLRPEDAVVVATMNRYDHAGARAALATGAGYVGLVASHRRAAKLADALSSSGIQQEELARLHSPAGLDLGTSSQEEIALAILAEIVAERHRRSVAVGAEPMCDASEGPVTAVDPICGMTVAVVPGTIEAEHGGLTYYFCGPGCRDAFLKGPPESLAQ